ncbi:MULTISPECIES: chemotaxis protein CheW [unclassified Microcoleus]|jgi:chemotaxis signal transduction protein|uniref:chemotaxis protein CheW n=1 Tax=unclassified Microcoleus TaxID=2642155 RepID=UPI002FD5F50D
MLIWLFYVYDDRYALDCRPVVEIVPTFTLKNLHSAPEYIPGLFNYWGHLVRVIELCSLMQGTLTRA